MTTTEWMERYRGSFRRAALEAESWKAREIRDRARELGWMPYRRNGSTVWYDPEGGHVKPRELEEAIKPADSK